MPVLVFLFADLTPTSAVLLAVSLYAAASVFYFLLVDVECWPQFAVHAWHDANWAVASGRHYVREFVTDVRSFARLSLRDTALTATALLAFLTINPGATR